MLIIMMMRVVIGYRLRVLYRYHLAEATSFLQLDSSYFVYLHFNSFVFVVVA